MESKRSSPLTGYVVSAGLGLVIGACMVLGASLSSSPKVDRVEIFQRDDKPTVMRMYKPGMDGIMVEESDGTGYIRLDTYLDRFENESQKEIEKADIRGAVGWYLK